MSLSIIPLTQPLYNVYRAYEDVYHRYGSNVFVSALFRQDVAGAPPTVVKALADIYCDSLLSLYNLRVAIATRKSGETGIALYYAVIAIVILSALTAAIFYAVITNYNKKIEAHVDDAQNLLWFMMVYLTSTSVGFLFLTIIAVMAYKRMEFVSNKINNINFTESGSLFSNQLNEIFPTLHNNIGKNRKYLKYTTMPSERRSYDSIITISKMFSLVKGSGTGQRTYTLVQQTKNNLKALQAIYAYSLLQRGVQIDMSNLSVDGLHFPGFGPTFKPSIMLRDIQRVDLVGQVNRLGDAIQYFKDLLKKDAVEDNGSEALKKKIKTKIISLFTSKALLTKQFVPTYSFDDDNASKTIDKSAGDPSKCSSSCQNNTKCALSVYNQGTGECSIITQDKVQQFPVFYAANGGPSSTYDVFMKGENDVYISSPNNVSDMKALPLHMKLIDNKSHDGLDSEKGCMYNVKKNRCLGDNYSSLGQEPAEFEKAFADSMYSAAIANIGKGTNNFTIRTSTDNVIDTLMAKDPNSLERNKPWYIYQISEFIKREDPTLSLTLTDDDIKEIADESANAYDDFAPQMKDLVITVLTDLPSRLNEMKNDNNDSEAIDYRDIKYITGKELISKIENMNNRQFVGNYFTHVYNLYACSNGLYKLHEFYDYTVRDIEKGKLILSLFATLVMLEGILFTSYFALSTLPEFSKQKLDLQKKLDNAESSKDKNRKEIKTLQLKLRDLNVSYAMKYLIIAAVLIVTVILLMVSAQRRERIGMYNYDIMRKNGDILKQSSLNLLNQTLEEINRGSLLALPQNSSIFPAIKDTADRTYIIDAFKDNMMLFDAKKKVEIGELDGKYFRDLLVDIIESHDKCNSLLFGANINMPFPVYEVSIYVFLVIVVAVCLFVVTQKLKPGAQLKNIRFWKQVQNNKIRGIEIDKCDLAKSFTTEDLDDIGGDSDLVVKMLALMLIPIATLLFSSQLLKSTSDLSTALYGSNLYRSNFCYNI